MCLSTEWAVGRKQFEPAVVFFKQWQLALADRKRQQRRGAAIVLRHTQSSSEITVVDACPQK